MFVGGLMGCNGEAYKATEILAMESTVKYR